MKFYKQIFLIFYFFVYLSLPSYSEITDKQLSEYIDSFQIEELIGQKIIISPPWLLPFEFEYSSNILDIIINEFKIGNFIINKTNYMNWVDHLNKKFDNNQDSNTQTNFINFSSTLIRKECNILQDRLEKYGKTKGIPAIISTDYEGGRVQHLPFTKDKKKIQIPSAMNLAAIRSPKKTRKVARFIAKNLKSLGVNVNLAPVLDLNYIGETSLIGTRSFSCNDEIVSILSSEFSKGLIEGGVAPVLKHWPGHGPVTFDSKWNKSIDFHFYPKPLHLQHDEKNFIENKYLKPYYRIFESNFIDNCSVMTSHLIANSLGCPREKNNPVTFCKEAIDDYLRKKFNGVVIADDFVLLSSTHSMDIEEAIWKSFKAGNDMVIIGSIHLADDYQSKQKKAQKLFNINKPFEINLKKIKIIMNYLKEQYLSDKKDRIELKKSVFRILRWKLNIQKMRNGRPKKNKIWDFSVFKPDTDDEILYNDNELNMINNIFYDSLVFIQYHLRDAIRSGGRVLCPIELSSSVNEKIFCITPALRKGDLKPAFEELGINNTIQYELKYDTNKDNFVSENVEKIINQIENYKIKLIIFGLVNIHAHTEVLNQLKSYIDNKNINSIVICFHDPSILSSVNIPKNALVFSTFSNKFISNLAAAKFLNGDITIRDINFLPVRHSKRPVVETLIEEYNFNDYIKEIINIKLLFMLLSALISICTLSYLSEIKIVNSTVISMLPVILILIFNLIGLQTIEVIKSFSSCQELIELIERYSYPDIVIDVLVVLVFPYLFIFKDIKNKILEKKSSV